jgi:hypothetical protein
MRVRLGVIADVISALVEEAAHHPSDRKRHRQLGDRDVAEPNRMRRLSVAEPVALRTKNGTVQT